MLVREVVESKKTWMKDGVEMCSKDCCGQPVTECTCGPDCKYCDCNKVNETGYGLGRGVAQNRSINSQMTNVNKRGNNKAQDQNREQNIRVNSANRRANRLSSKIPTGMPSRLLNPQQPQAPA